MRTNITLDEKTVKALNELVKTLNFSKSELIRKSVEEYYLKEKRAENNLLFFVDAYNSKLIDKNTLFMLLPRSDAEHVIIGSHIGKGAADYARKVRN